MFCRGSFYSLLMVCFTTVLILGNIISAKWLHFPGITSGVPAGLFTFMPSFIILGLTAEVYGKHKAQRLVHVGFVVTLVFFVLIECIVCLPDAPGVGRGEALMEVFSFNLANLLSSLIAFVLCQTLNIYAFEWIRGMMFGMVMRSFGATVVSQFVDTFVTNGILFTLFYPTESVVFAQVVMYSYGIKLVLAALSTPVLCLAVEGFKRYTRGYATHSLHPCLSYATLFRKFS